MGILTKTDIERLANKRAIAIIPIDKNKIIPLGYDLALGEIITLEFFFVE